MLLHALEHHFRTCPDQIAYECGEERLTYRQLWLNANALACRLPGSGPVLLYGHKEPGMLVGMTACLLSGRAYIPCDIGWPIRRVQQAALQADAHCLIFMGQPPVSWDDSVHFFSLSALLSVDAGEALPLKSSDFYADKIGYILFTSGSSGAPKGIPIKRRNINHFTAWLTGQPSLQLCPGETVLNQASFSFDLSLADLTLALFFGARLFAIKQSDQQDPARLFPRLYESRAAVMVCTPTYLELCLCERAFSPNTMPCLRTVFCCGEVLCASTAQKFAKRFPNAVLLNAYGPTEATCAVSAVPIDTAILNTHTLLPVGICKSAAVTVTVLDSLGNLLPEGSSGELALQGPSVFESYLSGTDRPARFSAGRYRTGDSGFIKDGLIYCTGRLDDQLKYCGYRIETGEIEAALNALPGVEQAVLLPQKGADGKVRRLAAVLQAPPESRVSTEELRRLLSERLPSYMLPNRFLWMDRLPMTQNGKCDRKQLAHTLFGTPL